MYSGLGPFDVVLTWQNRQDGQERTLIVEIDGKIHYYSDRDRHLDQRSDFKYRLFDLYGLTYTQISCFDHMKEGTEDSHNFEPDSVLEAIQNAVIECDLAGPSKYTMEDLEDFFIK